MKCKGIHFGDIQKLENKIYQKHDDWKSWCMSKGVSDRLRDATWNYYRVQYYCDVPNCECTLAKISIEHRLSAINDEHVIYDLELKAGWKQP